MKPEQDSSPDNSRDTFSARLVITMKARGVTQAALAHALHISQAAVSGWLRGAKPLPRVLRAVAEHLGVNDDWLSNGLGPVERPSLEGVYHNPRIGEAIARIEKAQKDLDEAVQLLNQELKKSTVTPLDHR